jgi:hydrogenase nickel incorporation protein HypA/HybF
MHEMGIAMQIVKIATDAIPDGGANTPVKRVDIRVGKLTAIVPESLRFCFEIIVKDTPLSGAELNIEEVPIWARCIKCDYEWKISHPVFKCSQCDNGAIDIISGQELEVASIEIVDTVKNGAP